MEKGYKFPRVAVSAFDPRLRWTGRMALREDGWVAAYPGVSLSFRLSSGRGWALVAVDSEDCWLEVEGSSSRAVRLSKGENRIAVPGGVLVRVTKRTEAWQGSVTWKGLVVEGGELLPCPKAPERKLLFIGDSITCGASMHHGVAGGPKASKSSDATRSFGMLLGRSLGAEVHLVSCGGRGLMRDYLGGTANQAPEFFERALPDDPASVWDHFSWQPDAVVIGLGTNDFNPGLPDYGEWTAAYIRFVRRVREVHPAAKVVLTSSPIFPMGSEKRQFLERSLAAVSAATGADWVSLRHQKGTSRDGHPTARQHEDIAADLMPFLSP